MEPVPATVVRPVPDWMIGDWFIAGSVSLIVNIVACLALLPARSDSATALFFAMLIFGAIPLTIVLRLALRQAGSLVFNDEGIVLTRFCVTYRRIAWRDVRSAYLWHESDPDSGRAWRQVFLVLRGGRKVRFPITFPEQGRHSGDGLARCAAEHFLRYMTDRRIAVEGLP